VTFFSAVAGKAGPKDRKARHRRIEFIVGRPALRKASGGGPNVLWRGVIYYAQEDYRRSGLPTPERFVLAMPALRTCAPERFAAQAQGSCLPKNLFGEQVWRRAGAASARRRAGWQRCAFS